MPVTHKGNRIQNLTPRIRDRARQAALVAEQAGSERAFEYVAFESRRNLAQRTNRKNPAFEDGRVDTRAMLEAWLSHGVVARFFRNRLVIGIGPPDPEGYFRKQEEGFEDGGWKHTTHVPGMHVSPIVLQVVYTKFRREFKRLKGMMK